MKRGKNKRTSIKEKIEAYMARIDRVLQQLAAANISQ
jgi:hypothetical protein